MKEKNFFKINSHNECDKLKEIIVETLKGKMPTLIWKGTGELSENYLKRISV